MAIYPNIYQTLVPCPIVELRGYLAACGLKGRLYAYLDYNGPTGTSRDSVAEGMLALAAEKHKLLPGQPIIEAASGSFAMALALAGRTAGHPVGADHAGGCPGPAAGIPAPAGGADPAFPRPAGPCGGPGAGRDHRSRKRAGII